MIHEFNNPISVVTTLGSGMAIYVQSAGTFENDIWRVALKQTGHIKHFLSRPIAIDSNHTFGITNISLDTKN